MIVSSKNRIFSTVNLAAKSFGILYCIHKTSTFIAIWLKIVQVDATCALSRKLSSAKNLIRNMGWQRFNIHERKFFLWNYTFKFIFLYPCIYFG